MKHQSTRVLLLVLAALTFFSCNEEEFYEKEFIQSIQEEYAEENPFEDSLSTPETSIDEQGESLIPGNDSSNDDDVADGNDSNNDDDVADGNDSNNDDDVADGNDSSNDDDVADGNDSNNDDDVADGNDSNNDDDVADGNDSNDNDSTDQSQLITDNFIQTENGHKLDLLWVIDNSGSMRNEQESLGRNLNAFINEFKHTNIDFQMSFTTTDVSSSRNGSKGSTNKNSSHFLTSEMLEKNERKFLQDFERFVNVGTKGSGHEQGIEASKMYLESDHIHNNKFREDAILAIIYVSDEDDQSPGSIESYYQALTNTKDQAGFLKVYSVVSFETQAGRGITPGHERYQALTQKTGGFISDIDGDFYQTLINLGKEISNLSAEFPLSQQPISEDEISVIVNGEVNTSWSYKESTNSIVFIEVPESQATIAVNYKVMN